MQTDAPHHQKPAHLKIDAVSKRFGATTVLTDINFAMSQGELLTLLGPSGCGKTTLLRVIAGLAHPDTGTVVLGERDITRSPPYRRNVGVVFQNYALFPHLNVAGNVAFGLKLRRQPKDEIDRAVRRALSLVHLEHLSERPISALSGGQQQRVALARALAVEPSVILFDEALSALDRKLREAMQGELRRLLTEIGATAIFVTHDQEEALTMSDRIAVMHQGRIDQLADPRTLYDRPATAFALSFVGQSLRLTGKVTSSGGGHSLVATEAGEIRVARALSPGQPVIVATRPEHVRLTDGENTLAGTVAGITFQGARTTVEIESGSARVTAELAGRTTPPERGATIRFSWPVAETLVYEERMPA
jgi:putative spermidine/putrescine transport system ATP-binding protein